MAAPTTAPNGRIVPRNGNGAQSPDKPANRGLLDKLPEYRKEMTALDVVPIQVQYACNGRYFALSIKDTFGSLSRETIMKYLARAASVEGTDIERKAGGAGLGLLTVLRSVSKLVFNLSPKSATEVVALFDMELFAKGKMGARSLNIFVAQPKPVAQIAASASGGQADAGEAAPASGGQRTVVAMGGLAALVVAALAVVLILRGNKSDADARRPTKLVVVSSPEEAAVLLDDKEVGRTGSELDTAGASPGFHRITVRKPGFRDYNVEVDLGQAMGSVLLKAPLLPLGK
jgi:hypothetical protein